MIDLLIRILIEIDHLPILYAFYSNLMNIRNTVPSYTILCYIITLLMLKH